MSPTLSRSASGSSALEASPAAELHDLRIETSDGVPIVDGVSLTLAAGEVLGVVGESGSGKTTAVLALLGFAQRGARITRGEIRIADEVVSAADERALRRIRGRLVAYVPQNPGIALNPSLRVGDAIAEMVRAHSPAGGRRRTGEIAELLELVGLPGDPEFTRRYPHQLSGGQQQRVCIGIALVCKPPVVVLDEPTTGLDVITQAKILDELSRLRRDNGTAMVYVSHDLAVVAEVASRVAVMYAGRIIEEGPTQQLLRSPKHPYTRGLLMTLPDHAEPRTLYAMPGVTVGVGEWPVGCGFASRCPLRTDACEKELPELRLVGADHRARCVRAEEVHSPDQMPIGLDRQVRDAEPVLRVSKLVAEHQTRDGTITVAKRVSFEIGAGECVALVGGSGSGKTTIARTIVGLHPPSEGTIELCDETLPALVRRRSTDQRRRIQIISQDPADSLNPQHTVRRAIARPARMLLGLSARDADAEVGRLLELIRLPARTADSYPMELSGGERQRVAIARALAAKPELVICDEVTSALDVSVQAAVLDLLNELRERLRLAMLFITHDFGVVATVADRVLVLDRGSVCEAGATAAVLKTPEHDYTVRLLEAAPSISQARAGWAEHVGLRPHPGHGSPSPGTVHQIGLPHEVGPAEPDVDAAPPVAPTPN